MLLQRKTTENYKAKSIMCIFLYIYQTSQMWKLTVGILQLDAWMVSLHWDFARKKWAESNKQFYIRLSRNPGTDASLVFSHSLLFPLSLSVLVSRVNCLLFASCFSVKVIFFSHDVKPWGLTSCFCSFPSFVIVCPTLITFICVSNKHPRVFVIYI